MPWLLTVIPCSLLISWLGGFVLRRYGPRWGLVDRPGARKVHDRPMPTSGGIAIWLGLIVPLAVLQGMLWLTFDARPAPQRAPEVIAGLVAREDLPEEIVRH